MSRIFAKSSYFLELMNILTPTICANQDFVHALIKRNPEEIQIVMTKILPPFFHIDLDHDFDVKLSTFCKKVNETITEPGKHKLEFSCIVVSK